MSPPSTTVDGFRTLTASAIAIPSSRAPSLTSRIASGSRARIIAIRSREPFGVVPERPQVARERPAARLGLDAADSAAHARLLDAGHRDVADVARGALGARGGGCLRR